jgi:hypothetical protein
LAVAKAEFDAMLRDGTARRAEGPWSSALHLVPKKARGWRPCGDHRAVNARAIPEQYPVPHKDYVQHLSDFTIFTKIELVKAYHQIPIHTDDIQKTAITNPFCLFEFPFMYFGMRNAVQTFQRFLDILKNLDICFAYLNDILSSAVPPNNTSIISVPSSQRSKITASFSTRPNVFSASMIFPSSVTRFHPPVSSLSGNGLQISNPVLSPRPPARSDVSWEC